MNAAWTRLSSAALYTRGKLTLREDAWRLPDGQEIVYPVLAVGVTVGVLPFVEPSRVLLVGQYRHLVGKISWELPGGGSVVQRNGQDGQARGRAPRGRRAMGSASATDVAEHRRKAADFEGLHYESCVLEHVTDLGRGRGKLRPTLL